MLHLFLGVISWNFCELLSTYFNWHFFKLNIYFFKFHLSKNMPFWFHVKCSSITLDKTILKLSLHANEALKSSIILWNGREGPELHLLTILCLPFYTAECPDVCVYLCLFSINRSYDLLHQPSFRKFHDFFLCV